MTDEEPVEAENRHNNRKTGLIIREIEFTCCLDIIENRCRFCFLGRPGLITETSVSSASIHGIYLENCSLGITVAHSLSFPIAFPIPFPLPFFMIWITVTCDSFHVEISHLLIWGNFSQHARQDVCECWQKQWYNWGQGCQMRTFVSPAAVVNKPSLCKPSG